MKWVKCQAYKCKNLRKPEMLNECEECGRRVCEHCLALLPEDPELDSRDLEVVCEECY